jgi:hypothetical protein
MPTFLIDPTWVIAISIIILTIAIISHVLIANKSFKASKEKAEAYREQTIAMLALKESLDAMSCAINKLPSDFLSPEDRQKQVEKIIKERNINALIKSQISKNS